MFEDKTVDSSETRHPPVEVGSLSVYLIAPDAQCMVYLPIFG